MGTLRDKFPVPLPNFEFGRNLSVPHLGSAQRFLLLSILIGVFAGLLVVCFHFLIEFVTWNTIGVPAGESVLFTLLFPPMGAFISVLLIRDVFPLAGGSGINNTKAAIYVSDGYVPLQSVVGSCWPAPSRLDPATR